jgi:ribosomal protein L44E
LAARDKSDLITEVNSEPAIEQINRRLEMVDRRLDSMDSVITSLVERVMDKPLTLEITCPKCGQAIQVNITSNVRIRG